MRAAREGRETSVPPVRVDVLGPLRLTVAGEPVEVPGPKRRALLALLAMAETRAVAVDDLLDALWPADVPDSGRASLQSQVSRLRNHLGPAAARLEAVTGGYRLRLDGDDSTTDVARARSLLAASKEADPAGAHRALEEARSLWRGPPLAEFVDVAPLAAWAVTLDGLRRAVEEAYVAAALDAGATGDALEAATALVAQDPLSEPAVVLLMRALDASGRGADALRAAHDHRRRLVDETGLEPSPAIGELERTIAGRTSSRPGTPARPSSRLRGRDSELAALHRLLAHERLVTLLGPGGVGKTRLAGEVAARSEQAIMLRLAPVTDGAAIPHALADALDLHVVQGDVLPACAALLAAGSQLLVIDNCEHVLAAVRDVVGALLDAAPSLTVLATSREPLGLSAEQRLRLAPLALTVPHDLDDLSRSPAVAVFVDRARRVQPDFAPDAEDLRIVADVVRRLDGMPLAIELAAGRLSSLGLADLHARLDRALDLLGEGGTTTLRQTIEWSYALLPEDEQRLFRHLGAFPAGFDLAAAEAVAADLGLAADPARALSHLVDTSMVEAVLGGRSRYQMLDVIRAFACDRLEAAGDTGAATERFLRWALELVTWIDTTGRTDREPLADRTLRREFANLRAAWQFARADGRVDAAVHILLELSEGAGWRDLTEVWEWSLELAEDPALDAHPDAAAALGIAGADAWSRGELDRAERLARRGLELGAAGGTSRCKRALSLVALSRGDLAGAVELGTESAETADRTDSSLGIAALAAAYQGELDAATALNERLVAISTSPSQESFHRYVSGEIDALRGEVGRAEDHYEGAIALARGCGATFIEGIASVGLLTLRANTGQIAEALDGYGQLVDYWERTGGWLQQWTTLRNLARLLHSLGDEEAALFIDAAADHAPDAPPVPDSTSAHIALPEDARERIRAEAAAADRARVLDVAREVIARNRGPGQGLPPSRSRPGR